MLIFRREEIHSAPISTYPNSSLLIRIKRSYGTVGHSTYPIRICLIMEYLTGSHFYLTETTSISYPYISFQILAQSSCHIIPDFVNALIVIFVSVYHVTFRRKAENSMLLRTNPNIPIIPPNQFHHFYLR